MIARRPEQRISLADVESSPFFDNVLVNTIAFLDNFAEKAQADKVQFLKVFARA